MVVLVMGTRKVSMAMVLASTTARRRVMPVAFRSSSALSLVLTTMMPSSGTPACTSTMVSSVGSSTTTMLGV